MADLDLEAMLDAGLQQQAEGGQVPPKEDSGRVHEVCHITTVPHRRQA